MSIPNAICIPFNIQPLRVTDEEGRPLRPLALVMGATFFPQLTTPEQIGGLQKPLPTDIRHATLTDGKAHPKLEIRDRGTPESGPIHCCMVVEGGAIRDILGRISHTVIVGYTPESIAEEVKQMVLNVFRKHPDHAGKPLDQPIPMPELAQTC